MVPVHLEVDAFTPGVRNQITQKALQFSLQIQQAAFTRNFLVTPLTGCDMLLGNPWLESHHPLLDSKAATFFLTEGVPTPTTIICNRRLLGIPLISHVQAHRAIRKGAECALLHVCALPSRTSIMSLTSRGSSPSFPPAIPSSLEPHMQLWWTSTSILC